MERNGEYWIGGTGEDRKGLERTGEYWNGRDWRDRTGQDRRGDDGSVEEE
jgi:hypothetical protein